MLKKGILVEGIGKQQGIWIDNFEGTYEDKRGIWFLGVEEDIGIEEDKFGNVCESQGVVFRRFGGFFRYFWD